MEIINIPTEQTTAATDAVLGLVTLVCLFYLRRFKQRDVWKTNIWSGIFGLLAFSAALGTLVHGFKMPEILYNFLWLVLFLTLGLTVALFILGAVYDLWGRAVSRRMLPVMLAIVTAFYAANLIFLGTFLVFIIYEVIAMTFALIVYGWLTLRKQLKGAGLMTTGIIITIIAAIFQIKETALVRFIWKFDNNGIFHLVQIVAVLFLTAGLRAGLLSGDEKKG